jgi:UDP-N-acetylglucosamine acyltransferase
MAYVHIAHDCHIGNNVILANSVGLAGHIDIDDYAIIGGMTGVHQFVHVGKHTMVGGGSLVTKDIPPYSKAGRNPISFVGVNSIGLRRRGYTDEQINFIHEIYRHLYLRGRNITQAVGFIEANLPITEERDEILNFIQNSQRGIMRGYKRQRE